MYSHLTPAVAAARTADDLRRAALLNHFAGTGIAADDASRRTARVRWAGRAGAGSARRPARA